jgi:arginyl-tRNA synthetase
VLDGVRKKIIVEFSSPNIGKEFDGAHLRSTIIGAYIASLYESMGWDVVRMNFLGDWGKNIGLLAVGWARFGSEELFDADPLKHLVDVYTKIDELLKEEQKIVKKLHAEKQDASEIETQGIGAEKDAFFKKMEDGDSDAVALWKRFREVCIANYTELYARLNISFDDYSGESDVKQATTAEVESILKEKGVCEESEGASIIDFNKHGSRGLGIAILRYSNGTSSYLLRDIAAVLERVQKYSFDRMVYVVSSKQDSHFLQLITAIELLGHSDLANRLEHVSFGKFKVKGSSQTQSNGHLLSNILDQCQTSIQEFKDDDPNNLLEFQEGSVELSNILSATALMTEELSIKRLSNFNLDASSVANTEGYTGLRLQHWFAKLCLRLKGTTINREELEKADYTLFEEEEYADILRLLVRFPDIVKASFKNLESPGILTYLFQITDLLPALPDQEAEGSTQNHAQLAFYESVRQVLENGMRIVGLVPIKL